MSVAGPATDRSATVSAVVPGAAGSAISASATGSAVDAGAVGSAVDAGATGSAIGPGATGSASTVGILRVGPAQVAVPLGILREVLPCPLELQTLPATSVGLLGATNVRGAVLPVLDLRPLLRWPEARTADQIVAVVSLDEQVLGLLCDEVLGVCRLADTGLQPLDSPGDGLLVSHSFEWPEGGGIVSVLDVARLFALPGLPAARSTARGASAGGAREAGGAGGAGGADAAGVAAGGGREAGRSAGVVEQVLMRCGPIRWALAVHDVHALLPSVRLGGSPLTGGACVGVTPYARRSIPAIDPLRLFGLDVAGSPATGAGGGLILRYPGEAGDGFVALLLDEVIEILPVGAGQILALPAAITSAASWFRGLASLADTEDFLVLDPGRLAGDPVLAGLAGLNVHDGAGEAAAAAALPAPREGAARPARGAGASPAPGGEARSGPAGEIRSGPVGEGRAVPGVAAGHRYLTYVAGSEVATPLLQVSEIIPFPERSTPIRSAEPAMLGVFTHRGAVVPLLCLPTVLGSAPATDPAGDPSSRVLIVTVDGGSVGFVVPQLRAIETSSWEEEAGDLGDDLPVTTTAQAAAASRVVRVAAEGRDRNLRTLDLAAIATVLTAPQYAPADR